MRLLDRAGALDESFQRRSIGPKMQRTILLVEDNEKYAEVIKLHLERAGHRVHIAYDGETALHSVGGIKPDIIFLDVMLPGIDGIAVCAKLKGNPDLKAIPVVVLTGRMEMTGKEKPSLTESLSCPGLESPILNIPVLFPSRTVIQTLRS